MLCNLFLLFCYSASLLTFLGNFLTRCRSDGLPNTLLLVLPQLSAQVSPFHFYVITGNQKCLLILFICNILLSMVANNIRYMLMNFNRIHYPGLYLFIIKLHLLPRTSSFAKFHLNMRITITLIVFCRCTSWREYLKLVVNSHWLILVIYTSYCTDAKHLSVYDA